MCSLHVSVLFRVGIAKKTTEMAETGIEPDLWDPESNALDHSAVAAQVFLKIRTQFLNSATSQYLCKTYYSKWATRRYFGH